MIPKQISEKEYRLIHDWLKKKYGRAFHCESKKCKKISSVFNWCLVKNKEYDYKRKNFKQLCRSCHSIYDTTENQRKLQSKRQKGVLWTKEQKLKYIQAKKKPVLQFSLDNNFIKKFNSINEASEEVGVYGSGISSNLIGRYKNSGGFIWKYERK